ncbi:T-cell surface glycoprotein CD1b-1-like [Rhynchocyon petersi]
MRPSFQQPTSFYVFQTVSFANSTWAKYQSSGWLAGFQIHGWDSESGTAVFLKPWTKGNFSDEEVTELEETFRLYQIGFVREVQEFANKLLTATGLTYRVEHSSLGDQDIVLYWGHSIPIGWICLAVIVPALGLLIGLALRYMCAGPIMTFCKCDHISSPSVRECRSP